MEHYVLKIISLLSLSSLTAAFAKISPEVLSIFVTDLALNIPITSVLRLYFINRLINYSTTIVKTQEQIT